MIGPTRVKGFTWLWYRGAVVVVVVVGGGGSERAGDGGGGGGGELWTLVLRLEAPHGQPRVLWLRKALRKTLRKTHRDLVHHPQDPCEERRRPNEQNQELVRVVEPHLRVWVVIEHLLEVGAEVGAGRDLATEDAK